LPSASGSSPLANPRIASSRPVHMVHVFSCSIYKVVSSSSVSYPPASGSPPLAKTSTASSRRVGTSRGLCRADCHLYTAQGGFRPGQHVHVQSIHMQTGVWPAVCLVPHCCRASSMHSMLPETGRTATQRDTPSMRLAAGHATKDAPYLRLAHSNSVCS
jgi:hypothetical protein